MEQTISSDLDYTTYDLSIQISLNGFSFCIQNEFSGIEKIEQVYFENQQTPERLLEKLNIIYKEHPFLIKNFATVTVVYQNELFSLVPKSLFDENQPELYLNYSVRTLPTDFIAFDNLEKEEAVMVYVPYVNINNFFFETYGSFSYYHSQSILLKTLRSQSIFTSDTHLICNLLPDSFELILLIAGKIVVVNSFYYQNEEDFLYYHLFTAEQYELDPEQFQLHLIGLTANLEKEPIYQLTKKYIRKINLIKPTIKNEELLKDTELKGLFTLLNTNHHAHYFR
ncbi:DUF3822 family protein [Aquimarina sp. ERC-38]|uniref:DUF3822 family protein n=1 Tax=Aquimarina sp. ERC-38 TaxID=2949996 RepID=UPI002247F637|nr:DUF3822 family protein [Aquimarina sp. ERC-38]UZO80051.1 DUF3822 family protein [Aquimarina sp. ERC-38]